MPTAKNILNLPARIFNRLKPDKFIAPEVYLLLKAFLFFLMATALSNTFLNIYLLKSASMANVIKYNISTWVTVVIFTGAAGWCIKKVNGVLFFRVGLLLNILMLILIIIMREKSAEHIFLLGFVRGVFSSFLYGSLNVMLFDFATPQNRDVVAGLQGLITAVTGLFGPLSAGFLISIIPGNTGYTIVFLISIILMGISCYISSKLPVLEKKRPYRIFVIIKEIRLNANWRSLLFGEYFRGFREGVASFLMSLLIYEFIKSENIVGINSFICGAIAIGANIFISKTLKPENRINFVLRAVITMFATGIMLLIKINIYVVFLYTMLHAFIDVFINVPAIGIVSMVIRQKEIMVKRRGECLAVREAFLNLGRISGGIMVLTVSKDIELMPYILFGITITQLIMWIFYRRIKVEE